MAQVNGLFRYLRRVLRRLGLRHVDQKLVKAWTEIEDQSDFVHKAELLDRTTHTLVLFYPFHRRLRAARARAQQLSTTVELMQLQEITHTRLVSPLQ